MIVEITRVLKRPNHTKKLGLLHGDSRHLVIDYVTRSFSRTLFQPEGVRITILAGALQFGLAKAMYEKLASEVTAIIHVAWTINFRMQLRSLAKGNINGVRNLVDLVLHTVPPRFAFCSSTASVANCPLQEEIPERILGETSSISSLGYSRSKWVAEQIYFRAHESTRLHSRITIFRVG